jgi:hypothetical protein
MTPRFGSLPGRPQHDPTLDSPAMAGRGFVLFFGARIWSVAIYTVTEGWHEAQAQRLRRVRRWLRGIVVPLLLIAVYLNVYHPGHLATLYRSLSIASFVVLVNLWSPFRRRNVYDEIAARFQPLSFEISSAGFSVNCGSRSKFIPRNKLARVEEPLNGRAMYVRTRNRFLWFAIPRQTDCYEGIKTEFTSIGVPIVEASRPVNWGFLFVFLYCSSLLCSVLTHNRIALSINLLLALILGISGIVSTNSWTGDRRTMIEARLGSFIPAVVAGAALLFSFGPF